MNAVAPIVLMLSSLTQPANVNSTEELIKAVAEQPAGATIQLAAGRYELTAALRLKSKMKLLGAGVDKTVITQAASWQPSAESLPDPETRLAGLDTEAYLIQLPKKSEDVEIAQLALRGRAPQEHSVHGAVFGFAPVRLHLHHVRIQDVCWSGLRTLGMKEARIHDCEFVDAGGRWKRGGIPGDKGGISGGAMFLTWVSNSEISHNHIRRSETGKDSKARAHYGIKGRQGRRCRIHHNTIETNFSIEFPFEGDGDMEIDHNVLNGAISIPKHAGGKVPESGRTFRIHHNYMTTSYAIEFVRNGVEIDHNLFDFHVDQDGGNLISGFGKAPAPGPAKFHNNLVSNPGRGVIWINEPYNAFVIRNNHIVTRTTKTPRKEGLFAFNAKSDFKNLHITNNVVECIGLARPLLRSDAMAVATVKDNKLTNVADAKRFQPPGPNAKPGLEQPLLFTCGVHNQWQVDGWKVQRTKDAIR